jgi:hypothetical protein
LSVQPALEVVLFRIKESITDTAFLREAVIVQAWIEQQTGFISRELLKTPDNQWLDTVRWTSLELAEAAAAKIMNEDHCQPFLAMIDETGIQMWHFMPQRLLRCYIIETAKYTGRTQNTIPLREIGLKAGAPAEL